MLNPACGNDLPSSDGQHWGHRKFAFWQLNFRHDQLNLALSTQSRHLGLERRVPPISHRMVVTQATKLQ